MSDVHDPSAGQAARGGSPDETTDDGSIDRRLFPSVFRFTVPYRDDPDFLDVLEPVRDYVARVYLPMPPRFMGSGRPWSGTDPATWEAKLPDLVRTMKDRGFEPELVCNALMPDGSMVPEGLDYIARLVDRGLPTITIAFLPFAKQVRARFPELEIKASTIAFIHDTPRLERWIQEAGIQSCVPDRSVTKDLPALRRLKASGVSLSLVMDDVCLPSCPQQFQHYMLFSQMGGSAPADVCAGLDVVDAHCGHYDRPRSWQMYQYYVVPADLHHYAGLLDHLKLSRGNTKDAAHLVREIRHYMDTRNRTHFYLGYYEPPEGWERVTSCDRICRKCYWCREAFVAANEPNDVPDGKSAVQWHPKDPANASRWRP